MPKRSNEFQRLVKLVQQSLAPVGAVVAESALVENQDTSREIDVLIDGDFGMYRMRIAVEAKDHSRALDVGAVEQIAAKYRPGDGILVNQVVMVSKSGFTKAAAEKARRSNIELLTLRQAELTDWTGHLPAGTKQTLQFRMQPHFHRIYIEPKPDADERGLLHEGRWICTCC